MIVNAILVRVLHSITGVFLVNLCQHFLTVCVRVWEGEGTVKRVLAGVGDSELEGQYVHSLLICLHRVEVHGTYV